MTEEYENAKRKGEKAYRRAVATGEYPYLPALDRIADVDKYAVVGLGIHEIPLDMIAGTRTQGRQNAFAPNFMPLLSSTSEFGMKWSRLYESAIDKGITDPIKVYEYMNRFYVEEGNKRVSVSLYIGSYSIYADIYRILPPKSDDPAIQRYYEFIDFNKVTGIFDIIFSHTGDYRHMAELMEQNLTDVWPDELVESVRAAFTAFVSQYHAKTSGIYGVTDGDAFLIYLDVYGIESLLRDTSAQISSRISRLWNEFQTGGNRSRMDLVLTPQELGQRRHWNLISRIGENITGPRQLRIALLHEKNAEDSSWAYQHDLGFNELKDEFGDEIDVIRFENCNTPESVDKALAACSADKTDIVFADSAAMMDSCIRAALDYPSMRIMNCSINLKHNAVPAYYTRMYEAKFLMGCLAASLARNHMIGYRADYPLLGSIANINAFALGALWMDPYAKIKLVWASRKDRDWEKELYDAGCSIISGIDLMNPAVPTRKYGLYEVIGANAAGGDGSAPKESKIVNLAMPVSLWGKYYEQLIRKLMDGSLDARKAAAKDKAINYWWGMSSGVVDVVFSDDLPYASKKAITKLRSLIISEGISPFEGEIHTQEGMLKGPGTPRLTDHEIVTMDWLCDNIIGEIPDTNELADSTQKVVKAAGVKEIRGENTGSVG